MMTVDVHGCVIRKLEDGGFSKAIGVLVLRFVNVNVGQKGIKVGQGLRNVLLFVMIPCVLNPAHRATDH